MSVVKINAIEVPAERSSDFEQRFAERAKTVESMAGFEGFELLRPVAGDTRYFVYTRWADDESFQKWVGSDEFRQGHAKGDGPQGQPVATHASLLQFEVVLTV